MSCRLVFDEQSVLYLICGGAGLGGWGEVLAVVAVFSDSLYGLSQRSVALDILLCLSAAAASGGSGHALG